MLQVQPHMGVRAELGLELSLPGPSRKGSACFPAPLGFVALTTLMMTYVKIGAQR